MATPDAFTELRGVTRTFGNVTALDDVTLAVGPGEIVGMLGPNGAGKSTLLNLVAGLRRPTSGTVRLFGGDPRDAASRLRLGTTPRETGPLASLRVREVVDFVAGHYPDPMPTGEAMDRFGLTEAARRQTGGLSGGQERRLVVALSIVGRPRPVLLDEPTTGLDVEARRILWDAVRDSHRGGATVVVTSHHLEEIEALAQRVVVIGSGRVLVDDELAAVIARVGVRRVRLRLPDGVAPGSPPGVLEPEVSPDGETTLLIPDADALVRHLAREQIAFSDLEVRRASLEEAFLALTATITPEVTR